MGFGRGLIKKETTGRKKKNFLIPENLNFLLDASLCVGN